MKSGFYAGLLVLILGALMMTSPWGFQAMAAAGSPAGASALSLVSAAVRPILSITSPCTRQACSNELFTIRGITTGNEFVDSVCYQLNETAWTRASTTNVWTNWSAAVTLSPGTNRIRVYAQGVRGSCSFTNQKTVVYVVPPPTDRLSLVTTGGGFVAPAWGNAPLQVGRSYTLAAEPSAGCLFAGWTGSVLGQPVISSAQAKLTFVMVSNLLLRADFVPNPFMPLSGFYQGLFYPSMPGNTNAVGASNSGLLSLTLNGNGGFSGCLTLQGANLPFTGRFNTDLQSEVQVARRGQAPLQFKLQLNPQYLNPSTLNNETNVITGAIQAGDSWTSDLLAYRAAAGESNSIAGSYTLLIKGCGNNGLCFGGSTNVPWGDGVASVQVTPWGGVWISGTLADGSPLFRNTKVLEQGFCAVYAPLYQGKGLAIGWMDLTSGNLWSLSWVIPSELPGNFYVDGVAQTRHAMLSRYAAPARGRNAVLWTRAVVELRENLWSEPLTNQVIVTNNTLRSLGGTISNLNLTISPSTGLISGRFTDPLTARSIVLRGAFVQEQDLPPYFPAVGGCFIGPDRQGGILRIHPE